MSSAFPSRSRDRPPKAWMDAICTSSTPAPTIFTFSFYLCNYVLQCFHLNLSTPFSHYAHVHVCIRSCSCLCSSIYSINTHTLILESHTCIWLQPRTNNWGSIFLLLYVIPPFLSLVVFLTGHLHFPMFIHRHIIGSRQITTRKGF